MDILILIGGFTILCLMGMPVAYALGLAAIGAALYVDMPLEAIMLKTSDGMDDFALLAIPFFILAGGIMAEGGMATRIVNLAKVFVASFAAGWRWSISWPRPSSAASRFVRCRHRGDRLGDDPADDQGRLSAPVRGERHHRGLAAAAAHPAVAQCGDLFARRRGTISVAHLFIAGVIPGVLLGFSLMVLCFYNRAARQLPERRRHPAAPGVQDRGRSVLGPDHSRHHHRRDPERHLHADRIRRGRLHLLVPGDDVHLSRLQMERAALLVGRVVRTVGMVMIMIGFSIAFGYMMAIMQVPAKVTQFFLTVSNDKYTFLFLINILLLVLGTFMDLAPMLLICTPIFLPS